MKVTIKFHNVNEGRGGVMKIGSGSGLIDTNSQPVHQVSHVGTLNCHTCVGLYFPIDAERCFCAHMNAFISRAGGHVTPDRCCNPTEGNAVHDMVLSRLEVVAHQHGFTASSIDRARIVMVCPYPGGNSTLSAATQHSPRRTGSYVIDAIRAFFQSPQLVCDKQAQGFVVDHADGSVQKVSRALPEMCRNAGQYARTNENVVWETVMEQDLDMWEVRIAASDETTRYADAVRGTVWR